MTRRILFFLFSLCCTAHSAETDTWTDAARKAGQSETAQVRSEALAQLRKQKNLEEKLIEGLKGQDRYLALEAISALQPKGLVPKLLLRVENDNDGFLTLTLSSLLDESNKDQILNGYKDLFLSKKLTKLTPANIVALLEPLGRLGISLPPRIISQLSKHAFPEVTSSVLQYVRSIALVHKKRDYDQVINAGLKATEFQLRLQTVTLLHELALQNLKPPFSIEQLRRICQTEKVASVRDSCKDLLQKGGIR